MIVPSAQALRAPVEEWMRRIYVAVEGADLRREDRRKALEVAALLSEIARAAGTSATRPVTLVDAAAGKSYVGLLAAKLLFDPASRPAHVITIEREATRAARAREAVVHLATTSAVDCVVAEVSDASAWPARPDVVAALHACGAAADDILDRAIAARARRLLLVPCCTSDAIPAAAGARVEAERRHLPRHAPVRRRFLQAMIDAERTLRLEAAGYQTEVVELVPPTVTPHNLLWRARHVGEPGRMAAAREALEALRRDGAR